MGSWNPDYGPWTYPDPRRPNFIQLEVTAGEIAGAGSPGNDYKTGDGYVQLNYEGKFTGDARFKFLNSGSAEDNQVMIAHSFTELGLDPAIHTHTIKGNTTLSGDLLLTDVYDLDVGGDGTIGHNFTIGADTADKLEVYGLSSFYEDVTLENLTSMFIGGNLKVDNSTVLGTSDANFHTLITGKISLEGDTDIGRNCGDDITIKGTSCLQM